jgi:hypothetical protein
MTFEERTQAVANFGFTERQARFLVTVMLNGGVCVPRQYAEFVGTAYGHNVNTFFGKLVEQGFAVECPCVHNRAQVYQVRYQRLYQAIGEPNSPNRKPIAAAVVVERLMLMDAIASQRQLVWLSTAADKVAFFTVNSSCLAERLPHKAAGVGASKHVQQFPNAMPIGVESNGRPVFVFLVSDWSTDELRAFLQRHADLLGALSLWALRIVLPPHLAALKASLDAVVRDELATSMSAMAVAELRWHFAQRRDQKSAKTSTDPDRFRRTQRAFAAKRWRLLFRRWVSDGDAALNAATSPAIRDALMRGDGQIQIEVLRHSYRHLSPLPGLVRSRLRGVEKCERTSGRSQPPTSRGGAASSAAFERNSAW